MRIAISLCFASVVIAASAAPTFVTGRMIDRRNGLTDEQYERLWDQGKNPAISQKVARDWVFRASRYQNVTNWLDVCGKTNDFAKLSYKLQDDNFELEETNKQVVAYNRRLVSSNEVLCVEIEYVAASNAVLEVDAIKAQKVQKNAMKAKMKDEKNFNKWIDDTEKAKKKSSDEMAAFYDAILELARIFDSAE